jgi:hypothetical protein
MKHRDVLLLGGANGGGRRPLAGSGAWWPPPSPISALGHSARLHEESEDMVAGEAYRALWVLFRPKLSTVLLPPRMHLFSHRRVIGGGALRRSRIGSVFDSFTGFAIRRFPDEGSL